MNNKNSGLEGFDYPDLDLSDNDSNPKDDVPSGEPAKKTKLDQSISPNNQVQNQTKPERQPVAFKPSAMFFPPPPPGSSSKPGTPWIPPAPIVQKTNYQQQNSNSQSYNNQQTNPRPQYSQNNNNRNQYQPYQKYDNRQKKSTVYVKNIPKSYLNQDKLMTFFKNEGPIKQIKVNQLEQTAVIKFMKEQHTAKFLKSNKIIFNRSYIVYGDNEFSSLSQQQVQDRINDELGNAKKAEQTNMKVLKEKVSNQLAENIRALYFLQKNLDQENLSEEKLTPVKEEIKQELDRKVEAKKLLEADNVEDFRVQEYNTNFYNWSLSFVRKSNCGIDRKTLFAEFLKYGPIISLDHECVSEKPVQTQSEGAEKQENVKHFLDYRFKLLFLGIKNAWNLYNARNEEMDLTVQGKQIDKFFESGTLKTVQPKKACQTDIPYEPLPKKEEEKAENPSVSITQGHNQPELKEVQEEDKKEAVSEGA